MRRLLISTKPFVFVLFLVGVTVRSPSHQRFPWALQLREQILKEQITDDGLMSSEDEGAVGLHPSGVVATAAPDPELTAMFARAAVSIGLEVNRPPSPEPSRLDD